MSTSNATPSPSVTESTGFSSVDWAYWEPLGMILLFAVLIIGTSILVTRLLRY